MLRSLFSKRWIYAYMFIAPAIILLIIFKIAPIFQTAWLSVMKYDIVNTANSQFVGLKNFQRLLGDRYILADLWHTVQYSLGTVIPGMVLSLLLSLILTERWFKGGNVARAMLFVPYVISVTIAGLIWSYIYNPTFGVLNYMLSWFGIPPQPWIGHPSTAMNCLIVMAIWKSLGYNITIWTAGLTGISAEYRDAARVDGASYLEELFYIRLPLLKPVILFLGVLGFINSFQSFDAIYVMTNGGPVRSTEVIVYYLWKAAFKDYNFGYAAVISWIVFVILIVLSLLQMKLFGREDK